MLQASKQFEPVESVVDLCPSDAKFPLSTARNALERASINGLQVESKFNPSSHRHCRSTAHSYLYLLPICACCKDQKLEEMTTKNQTLQDLGNPCIHV